MKSTNLFVTLCCCLVLFAACKKSDDNTTNNNNNNNNTPTTKQLLVAGKWQITADVGVTNYMGKDTTVDLYKEMEECEKDNFFTFADSGIGTQDENINVCPGKPQTQSAAWTLINNDTKLVITDSNPDTFDIEISSTQMKWKTTWQSSGGNMVNETFTLKNIK